MPIGELIKVVVLPLRGNQVRLGTNAPKHPPVDREELLERMADEE